MIIYPSDWLMIKYELPEQFHNLCDLGMKFEEFLLSMKKKGDEWISGNDIQYFIDLTIRIKSEYIKILEESNISEDEIKKVREDMKKVLTILMDPKEGTMRDISKVVVDEVEKGTINYWFQSWSAPVTAFIHSRIYDSLVESIRVSRSKILYNFVTSSTSKADIYPKIELKETISIEPEKKGGSEEKGGGKNE